MITRENLSRGEGDLVEGDPEIGSRKRNSHVRKWHRKKACLKTR
jgi:hypothetical protein